MPGKRKFKSAAVQELYDEVVGSDPSARDEFEQDFVNIEVAQLIHDMRTGAGLSQRALAKKVGTSASAINRLESDDYQGHTIAMVRRIATATAAWNFVRCRSKGDRSRKDRTDEAHRRSRQQP